MRRPRPWSYQPLSLALAVTIAACGHGDRGVAPSSSAPSASAPAKAPLPPPPAPVIEVDDHGCTIDDADLRGDPKAWRERAAALLAKKPHVAGEVVHVGVRGDTRLPKLQALAWALAKANATGILLRTPVADKPPRELTLPLDRSPIVPCTPVVVVEHDATIDVGPAGGGAARHVRRAPGKKGADLAGVAGLLRQRSAGCPAPSWLVAGAPSIPWSLVLDLAAIASAEGDGGLTASVQLLDHTPVPGQPVTRDE